MPGVKLLEVTGVPKTRGLNFLKPCPWCGGKASLGLDPEISRVAGAEPRYYVICLSKQCSVTARTIAYPDSEKAIRVWNTRRWPK